MKRHGPDELSRGEASDSVGRIARRSGRSEHRGTDVVVFRESRIQSLPCVTATELLSDRIGLHSVSACVVHRVDPPRGRVADLLAPVVRAGITRLDEDVETGERLARKGCCGRTVDLSGIRERVVVNKVIVVIRLAPGKDFSRHRDADGGIDRVDDHAVAFQRRIDRGIGEQRSPCRGVPIREHRGGRKPAHRFEGDRIELAEAVDARADVNHFLKVRRPPLVFPVRHAEPEARGGLHVLVFVIRGPLESVLLHGDPPFFDLMPGGREPVVERADRHPAYLDLRPGGD